MALPLLPMGDAFTFQVSLLHPPVWEVVDYFDDGSVKWAAVLERSIQIKLSSARASAHARDLRARCKKKSLAISKNKIK